MPVHNIAAIKEILDSEPSMVSATDEQRHAWLHTEVPYRDPTLRIDERDVVRKLGPVTGIQILDKLDASSSIPSRVKQWFKPDQGGITLYDPITLALLGTQVANGIITQLELDALLSAFETTQPRYREKGISSDPKIGHIAAARNS